MLVQTTQLAGQNHCPSKWIASTPNFAGTRIAPNCITVSNSPKRIYHKRLALCPRNSRQPFRGCSANSSSYVEDIAICSSYLPYVISSLKKRTKYRKFTVHCKSKGREF